MKTGDRVICIDANSHGDNDTPPLIRDREYIIYDIAKCSCGCIIYDVGLISKYSWVECYCGVRLIGPTDIAWANSKRFAKVKEEYRIIHMDIEVEEPILN